MYIIASSIVSTKKKVGSFYQNRGVSPVLRMKAGNTPATERKPKTMKTIFTHLTLCAAALLSLTTLGFAQDKAAKAETTKAATASTKKKTEARKSEKAVVTSPVALNKASASELESLPGIGPAIAARILEYRSEQGKFKEVSELLSVKGIGEKKLAQLREHVVLD